MVHNTQQIPLFAMKGFETNSTGTFAGWNDHCDGGDDADVLLLWFPY
jgi:hypothetical protein